MLLVHGSTVDGGRFRPSDWAERLAGHFATFSVDGRLKYSPLVFPTVIDGQRCLRIDPLLRHLHPAGFAFLVDFVRDHGLRSGLQFGTVPVAA